MCRDMDKPSDWLWHIHPIFRFHYLVLRHIHIGRVADMSFFGFIEVALLMMASKKAPDVCLFVKTTFAAA